MTKKKRDYAKRNVAYAMQSCDRVMERLLELQAMFLGHPSNYYQMLEQIAGLQLVVQQLIEKLCVQVWGKVPKNLDRWTGTGRDYVNRIKAVREEWESGQDNDNGSMRQVSPKLSIRPGATAESELSEDP